MVKITEVIKHSRAGKKGIKAGDILLKINGNEISDVLDYRFYLAESEVEIEYERAGKVKTVRIKKDEYDDIGLDFETPLMDEKQSCKNGCIFCFIDQNPEGLRDSLYFKDDDSRLSFLHGNYITLTNMTDKDVERIIKMRFSPINISVHTTNPELRVKMMKNKRSGEVLRYLDDFKNAGLSMCGQIVLCRGINDGEELLRTMTDLSRLYPNMGSVSVVPAGLTKFRDKLYPLTDFTKDEAAAVIDMIDSYAERMLSEHGSRMFFAADEFYLKAQREIPPAEYYEEYSQIENGVGLLRSFSDEAHQALNNPSSQCKSPKKISIATGAASYPLISEISTRVGTSNPNLTINTYKIINNFFGESITVSGLLTGKDIYEQLAGKDLGDVLFIPKSALRFGEDVFLCGMSLAELSEGLGVEVRTTEGDGCSFVDALTGDNIIQEV